MMNRIGRKGRNVGLVGTSGPQKPRRLDKFRIEYIWDFNKGSFLGPVSRVARGGGLTFSVHGASHATHHNHSVTSYGSTIEVFLGLRWSGSNVEQAGAKI